ncbi:VCBS repeat-containing protein [Streptomyces sp. NPDC032472]|uniref:FG-GAP repeat domain-containing protein n=1 Tax=Streptomyces sp. NPDC032472 TaxID=3155018 RepID=UPI0033DD2C79
MKRALRRTVICCVGLAFVAISLGVSDVAARIFTGRTASAAAPSAPPTMFPLYARHPSGKLRSNEPKGTGGFEAARELGGGFGDATAIVQANVSEAGRGNDIYHRMNGVLYYTAEHGNDTKVIGGGWDVYNLLVSVGNLGGSADVDLIGRDAAGDLWLYRGEPDGTLSGRIRIGTGWNGLNALAGRGDYTGDGKADLLARTPDGTLLIYVGTGNATVDSVVGARITVGTGWGGYKALVSTGDNDGDGKADLIASDPTGALWLFKGTGNPAAPFAPRVQIGASGWADFDLLF